MPDITKIKIGNERERSYKDFPANREFKKRAEDDNPGGGGWPADLPKPSVGGYGYTEHGEQIIVDNESVLTQSTGRVSLGDFSTQFTVVEGTYIVIFDGVEYTMASVISDHAEGYILGDPTFTNYPFMIGSSVGVATLATLTAGTHVVTIKGSSEVVHKIDEKYLPASGGVMVVNFESIDGQLVADKTLGDAFSAWENGAIVVARVDSENGIIELKPTTIVSGESTKILIFNATTATQQNGLLYTLQWGIFDGYEDALVAFAISSFEITTEH